MKRLALSLVLALTLMGCSTPLENNARDAAAALGGTLTVAIAQNQTACTANPTASTCQLIARGVATQNALITAIETYCGWNTTTPPTDMTAKCVPVKGAIPTLQSAIANANAMTLEVKGIVKP